MHRISGVLNVFFPFELKDNATMRQLRRMYNTGRDRQIFRTRHLHRPRTDMMDQEGLRDEMETIVALGQRLMGGVCVEGCQPYATPSLAQAYHIEREDNYFVQEPSVLISYFQVVCRGVNRPCNPMEGMLFYFNNLANHVGTYMLALKLQNLTIEEVVRLKHVFYKRAQIYIVEQSLEGNHAERLIEGSMTFQEYISQKSIPQYNRRKNDIDCRARYTFLEIDNSGLNQEEVYGLLTANEKYMYVPKGKTSLKNYSNSDTYSLFYHLRDALIVNYSNYKAVLQRQKDFFEELLFDSNKIPVEVMGHDKWIAGLEKGRFPEYLKTVEIHLLTNNALRHETVRHEISYYNPHVMFKRCHRLWKLFYEMDMNHCYINSTMFKNFGVYNNLRELKEEYTYLTTHCLNYSILAFTIIMAIFSLITVLK